MSWGTSIKVKHDSIYLQSMNLASMYDLNDQISECDKDIDNCLKRFENLAYATPKDIAPSKRKKDKDDDYESPYDFIRCQLDGIREELDELITTRCKLFTAQHILEDYEYASENDKEKINLNNVDDWNKIVTNG